MIIEVPRDPGQQIFQSSDGTYILGRVTTIEEQVAIMRGFPLPEIDRVIEIEVPRSKATAPLSMLSVSLAGILLAVNGPSMVQASTSLLGLNTSGSAKKIAAIPATASPTPTSTKSSSQTPTPKTSATPVPSTTPVVRTETQCLNEIPLSDKIDMSLLLGVYPSGDKSNETNNLKTISVLSEMHFLGGLVVMTAPNGSELVDYKNKLQYPQIIMVDQEGGPVQRVPYGPGNVTNDPKARIASQAEVGRMSIADRDKFIKDVLTPMYSYLKNQGFDAVLGPVVDVADSTVQSSPLENRTFGSDPKVVSEIALLYMDAAKAAGINVAPKHFPGLGAARTADGGVGNTDQRKMVVDNWNQISSTHLEPYTTIAQTYGGDVYVMVGTQTIPELTGDKPAALSKPAIDLLRQILPNAIIVTDDLVTPTITDSNLGLGLKASQAVVEALAAGVQHPMLITSNAVVPKNETPTAKWEKQLVSIYDEASKKAKESPEFVQTLNQTTLQNIESKGMKVCEVADLVVQRG